MIQQYYCKEKLDAGHSNESMVKNGFVRALYEGIPT